MEADNSEDVKKTVTLLSSDGMALPIDMEAVKKSRVIRRFFEDANASSSEAELQFPVPNTDGDVLKKIVGFLEHHIDDFTDSAEDWAVRVRENKISDFDKSLVEVEHQEVCKLIYAANFLDVRELMELCSHRIAGSLKGKTVEELREFLQISSDFTQEEEDTINVQNTWCQN